LEAPLWMSQKEYQQFRKDFDTINIIEGKAEEQELLPVLELVDATLSFANLNDTIFEKDLMEAGFCKKQVGTANYYCPTDKAVSAVLFLLECGWKVLDAKGCEVVTLDSCSLDVSDNGERLTVSGKAHFGTEEVDMATLVGFFRQKSRLISLGEKRSGLLS